VNKPCTQVQNRLAPSQIGMKFKVENKKIKIRVKDSGCQQQRHEVTHMKDDK
jgi:hypothetical protein